MMKKTAFPIYSGQDRQIVGANYDKGKQDREQHKLEGVGEAGYTRRFRD